MERNVVMLWYEILFYDVIVFYMLLNAMLRFLRDVT